MLLYIIIFLIPCIFYLSDVKRKIVPGRFLVFSMLFLAFFVGLGDMLGGYDRYIYGEYFDDMANDVVKKNPLRYSAINMAYGSEFGYVTFNGIMALITRNRYIFILVYTLLMYLMFYHHIRRYAKSYPLAIILFMGLLFYFSFTYLRQLMGVAIAAYAIKYIIHRRFWKFCLVMLLAYSFHNSAIVFFPVYFIPTRKFSRSSILYVMLTCLIVGASGVSVGLYEAYGEISDRAAHDNYAVAEDTRFVYIIEAAFFLFLLLKGYHTLPNNRRSIVLYNIGLTFCAVLLFFIRSDNGGRLSWYFMLGLIFSLVQLACHPHNRRWKMDLILLGVSFMLFYRVTEGWAFNMCPYKTFLTKGHTAEWIYERYEYDPNYDLDKFYR